MSESLCLFSIHAGLKTSGSKSLKATTTTQEYFLDLIPKYSKTDIPELEGGVFEKKQEAQAFLKKIGVAMSLPKIYRDEKYLIGLMDIKIHWKKKGDKCQILSKGKKYIGAELTEFNSYLVNKQNYPLFVLKTKEGDSVSIMEYEKEVSGLALFETVLKIKKGDKKEIDIVRVPFVNYEDGADISWMDHFKLDDPFFIGDAQQLNCLKLNNIGTRIKSASSMTMMKGISSKPIAYDIVQPFLIWFTRKGIDLPLMVAHIDREDWRE